MPRFFAEGAPVGQRITLTGENARHIAKALRMQPGEALTVCSGEGTDYACEVESVAAEEVTVRVLQSGASVGEPSVRLALFMALPKADKMDLIVQKATELGASEIVPVLARNCVSRPDAKALAKKTERWGKIAAEAAGQCGRGRIPQVLGALPFAQALARAAQSETPLLLYEAEREQSFRAALQEKPLKSVSLFVGPEGGFAPEEVRAAQAAGLKSVSLGARILRCETAPLAALSAVLYESGNL